MEDAKKLIRQLRGPWERVRYRVNTLRKYICEYIQKLKGIYEDWEPEQLYWTAKALALYRLMTGEEPEIDPREHYLYLRGRGGDICILYRSIPYRGPFTRGYRYISVDITRSKYKIIRVKVRKRCWRKK